ncbi:KIF-binding protein [Ptiloglossa arizonensis]|uniref:KIF-binding protein n=1 Tax=Ptiloglossa arizonensis TaxID=3350558 RepID=UPI003FA0B84E
MEVNTKSAVFPKIWTKWKDVRKLLDDHEKFSTPNEPYKLKYEAIEILKVMEKDLINHLTNAYNEEIEICLATVHSQLGTLYVDTEEIKAAEEQCMKCLKILKGKELKPEAVLPVVDSLNQLGVIWFRWNQPAKAKTFLEQAEQIYNDFTKIRNTSNDPINVVSLISNIEETKNDETPNEEFKKVHTVTLCILAQVYRFLKDHYKCAIYCHMTLRRQLGQNGIMQNTDYIEWALGAATLSQYFIEIDNFSQAKNHLAVASYILQKYEDVLKKKEKSNGQSEEIAAEWENFKYRSADVARCWAKYGIQLLVSSKQRLLKDDETEQENNESNNKEPLKSKEIEDLKFDIVEKEIEPIARQITDKYLLDFDDARLVFLNVQKWLDQAKLYYTLEDHASDHILIVQDISQAYKYLAFFEEHEDRQAKMHKKRTIILENIINKLNPQYYKSACRQIWFELGETYYTILDIKLDQQHSLNEKLTPQATAKINHLIKNAIKNFQSFLDSSGNRSSDSEIEPFPDSVLQVALISYFNLGRLYSKIITTDEIALSENTQKSINAYKFFINYCEKFPDAAYLMRIELSLCKELLQLILKLRCVKTNKLLDK